MKRMFVAALALMVSVVGFASEPPALSAVTVVRVRSFLENRLRQIGVESPSHLPGMPEALVGRRLLAVSEFSGGADGVPVLRIFPKPQEIVRLESGGWSIEGEAWRLVAAVEGREADGSTLWILAGEAVIEGKRRIGFLQVRLGSDGRGDLGFSLQGSGRMPINRGIVVAD